LACGARLARQLLTSAIGRPTTGTFSHRRFVFRLTPLLDPITLSA
jgi:hypothetical protein